MIATSNNEGINEVPKLHVEVTQKQMDDFSQVAKFEGRTKGSLQTEWISKALAKSVARKHSADKIKAELNTEVNE